MKPVMGSTGIKTWPSSRRARLTDVDRINTPADRPLPVFGDSSRRSFLRQAELSLLSGLLPAGLLNGDAPSSAGASGVRQILTEFRIREKALDFFEDARHPATGLYFDRLRNASGPTHVNNMLSLAATGYGLAAEVLMAEAGRISPTEVAHRLSRTLDTVERLNKPENGYFLPHFIRSTTRENLAEISTVDTLLFYLGAMAAAQYCGKELTGRVNRMFRRLDFEKMRTRDGQMPASTNITHGLDPAGEFIASHWGEFYSEGALLVNLMALASDNPSPGLKKAWTEGWDRRYLWRQDGKSTFYNHPLFTYFYGHGFFDLKNKVDGEGADYWEASRNAALMQQEYCAKNWYPGKVFGLTACDGPIWYQAYHVHQDDGTVAPPAILACLPFAEDAVSRALPFLKENHLLESRYGPVNAYNVFTDWQAKDALGVDVGSMMLMLDAWEGGTIHRLIGENELVQLAMTRAGFRKKPPAG